MHEIDIEHDALASLVTVFACEADRHLTEMASALSILTTDRTDTAALHAVSRVFHNFAGIGGIAGFELLNLIGARGERLCSRLKREAVSPTADQVRGWWSVIDMMRAEVEELKSSVGVAMECEEVAAPMEPLQLVLRANGRILSVEDDPAQAAYFRSVLESAGYDVHTCADPAIFEREMNRFAPDLILMDILLPATSGYDLARIARRDAAHQHTPILFLTTEGQLGTRIESMRSGGDDHLVKPVAPNLLLATVETRLARAREVRKSLERDHLTGLLNRGAFTERLHAHVSRSTGNAVLVMLDVDRFKSLNDAYGHPFGDQVLTRLASHLRNHMRPSDCVGRYGGEEFAMLLDGVSELQGIRIVEKILDDFAATEHITPSATSERVTFSAGVAKLPTQISALPQTWAAADAALYRAKASGRRRVCAAMEQLERTA